MASKNTTVLITGASRGIGRGLVGAYLLRSNITVIAAVRNPIATTSTSLNDLPRGTKTQLIIVKIDSASESDAKDAVGVLRSKYRIDYLDVVIANAGISRYIHKAGDIPISEVVDHYHTNVVGVLVLFQAVEPLLIASNASPRFVTMSSTMGSIGAMLTEKNTAYGPSKAALNYMTKKIHMEYEYLIAFPLHPGWVQTEMGNLGATQNGMEKADITVDESVIGLMDKIDDATRENSGGKFISYDGAEIPW